MSTENIHARTTVGLPSMNSRAAARAALERDVAIFLARGGQIQQVGIAESTLAGKSMADVNAGPGTLTHVNRPNQKQLRERVTWTPEMVEKLRKEFHRKKKDVLAGELGVTVSHLYNKAARLRITGDRRAYNKTTWTEEKLQVLRDSYGTKSPEEIAEAVGVSKSTLYLKVRELGLSRQYQPARA